MTHCAEQAFLLVRRNFEVLTVPNHPPPRPPPPGANRPFYRDTHTVTAGLFSPFNKTIPKNLHILPEAIKARKTTRKSKDLCGITDNEY